MANAVITYTAARIDVVFNDQATAVGFTKGSWKRSEVIAIKDHDDYIDVLVAHDHRWIVRSSATSHNAALLIDSIDGVSITTHAGLYSALQDLII